MNKTLIVDFNGTSSIYTHYLSNGLKNTTTKVTILGKMKPKFLDVFSEKNDYIGFNIGIKLIDYILNWFWILYNYKKFDTIIIQWLQLLKHTSLEIYLLNYLQNNIKLIYIVHNVYPHNNKKKAITKRYNKLYKKCKNIAVQTNDVKKSIAKISSRTKIIQINHGLFFKEFRDNNVIDYGNKCLMVGYISKYKGIEDAIQVIHKLKQEGFDLTLEIIGFGSKTYIEYLNEMIETLNLSKQISIISEEVSTNFMIEKIKKNSVLLLPYKKISQSGVAYTSIGLGVPIVTYDVGNFKEIFGEKNVAEIVEEGNLEEFSEALKKILLNNSVYKKNIRKEFNENFWTKNKNIYFE